MHGGDIYNNKVDIDFSISLNPSGVSENIKKILHESIDKLNIYPDMECGSLRKELSKYHDIEKESIVCANGASEILLAICNAFKPHSALLTAPGFTGYEYVLKSLGTKIMYHTLKEENDFLVDTSLIDRLKSIRPDIMFVTNPNNPTGRLINPSLLSGLLETAKTTRTCVVVDECFLELSGGKDKQSVIKMTDRYDNLMVVRAFTKSYALAGLRLGYCISSKENICKIKNHLPEWNVSVMSQAAGVAALQDEEYLINSLKVIKEERQYLTLELKKSGYKVYPSDCNFILLYDKEKSLYDRLSCRKILIRDCSDFAGLKQGYYRIAIRSHEDNETLVNAIKKGVVHE